MTTYSGNQSVRSGYYLSTHSWNVEVVPSEGGRLPGAAADRFLRVPFPLLFVVVPLLGLAFLMFLPFIGFALFTYAVARRITGHVAEGAAGLAATVAPDLAAGAASLTGARPEIEEPPPAPAARPATAKEAEAAGEEPLAELEREIAAKRR